MNNNEPKTKQIYMPDSYIIIFFVILLCAILTYVVPLGYFSTHEIKYVDNKGNEKTRTVLDPSTFKIATDTLTGKYIRNGIPLFTKSPEDNNGRIGIFNYVFEGLTAGDKWGTAVGIVAFILVIGGAFGIILKTGAVEASILAMIKKTKGKEFAIIPILFILFSLGGAIFGMGEEAIAFAMIIIPIVVAMGYDSIVGILITYGATQIGFGTSWMNPFSLAVAQGISGIPVMSGAKFRIFMWFVFTLFGIIFTWIYAIKIKKNPTKSCAYESDKFFREDFKNKEEIVVNLNIGHILVLLTVIFGVIWVIWGVLKYGYYIPEIATQFFIMGIVSGIIGVIFKLNNMKIDDIASSFRDGAKDLIGAAIIVGMAKGIILVLGGADPSKPTVLNTILHYMGSFVEGFPSILSAWLMLVFQSIFNFFVVSGSGQAALTMPIMAPLSDIVGVTRQVACLAFQLGDGLTNLIVPTSGCLMAVLGIARLDWSKWLKFQIIFQLLLFILSSIFVITAVIIGYN